MRLVTIGGSILVELSTLAIAPKPTSKAPLALALALALAEHEHEHEQTNGYGRQQTVTGNSLDLLKDVACAMMLDPKRDIR